MPIKSIEKSTISDQVYEQLLSGVASGEWQLGEKIPSENELSGRMGVSRNSVRGAIQRLAALGILEARQGEGTFVSATGVGSDSYFNALVPMLMLNRDNLTEILEFRRIIEVETVRLSALRAEESEIRLMEELNSRMRNEPYTPEGFAEMDMLFHEIIARSAKNSVLNKVFGIVKTMLITNQIEVQKSMGPKYSYIYHPKIVNSIRRRDHETAARLMKEHINSTIACTVRITGGTSEEH